ncbi:MAG TPA: hypothetical protein VN854_00555, partial [Mycoplasmatales bacterium]|nr:hypothetical protein [Mycoplasmatales bacterium]
TNLTLITPTLGAAGATSINGTIVPTTSGGTTAWIKLGTFTASNSPSVPFTGLTTSYTKYVIEYTDVIPVTSTGDFQMQFGTGSGPSWETTAYDYAYNFSKSDNTGGGMGATNQSTGVLTISQGNSSGSPSNGNIDIIISGAMSALYDLMYIDNLGVLIHQDGCIYRNDGTAITGIQFTYSNGNISSGNFILYGVLWYRIKEDQSFSLLFPIYFNARLACFI